MPPHFPPTHTPVRVSLADHLPFLICLLVFDRFQFFLLLGGCLPDCNGGLITLRPLLQLIMASHINNKTIAKQIASCVQT
jgi:hypothetical protein